jgi:hypothetical protein
MGISARSLQNTTATSALTNVAPSHRMNAVRDAAHERGRHDPESALRQTKHPSLSVEEKRQGGAPWITGTDFV